MWSAKMRYSPWSSSNGSKGKGKGKKGVCWNCGESDHYSRDCPNDKQDNSWTDGGAWKNQKGSKAGKDAGKGWDAGKSNWNSWRNTKGKGKDWQGSGKSQEWQGQNRQNVWSTPTWKGKSSTKGSTYSVDDTGDWWAQSDESQQGSQSEEEIHFCMLSEGEVQNQRHEVHQREDAERGWTQGDSKNVQRKDRQGRGINTHTTDIKHSAF